MRRYYKEEEGNRNWGETKRMIIDWGETIGEEGERHWGMVRSNPREWDETIRAYREQKTLKRDKK